MNKIDKAKYITQEYAPFLEHWKGKFSILENEFLFSNKQENNISETKELKSKLPKHVSETVINLVKGNDIGILVSIVTAFSILLRRYKDEEIIVIDSPLVGDSIGVNLAETVSFIQHISDTETIKEILLKTQKNVTESYKFQNFPAKEVLDIAIEKATNIGVFYSTIHRNIEAVSDKDLTLIIEKKENEISINYTFNSAKFDNWFIQNFNTHLVAVLEKFNNLDTQIKDIDFLTVSEKTFLLDTINATNCSFPDKLIHQIFEEQVAKTPTNIALKINSKEISYQELNNIANTVAHYILENYKTKPNDIVGILLDRDEWMIISILAILKAGACYLPIDIDYPSERINYTIEDSNCKFIITKSAFSETIKGVANQLHLDKISLENCSNLNPAYTNSTSDMCYIIYTSGSTGKPKGVMIQHYNVVRLLFNDKTLFNFSQNDTWSLFHSYCFDFSVWEMYGALLYGGKLVIVPKNIAQNTSDFVKLVASEKITVLNQTPGAFYNFISEAEKNANLELNLRYVIFGGEALLPSKLNKWHKKYPTTTLVNMYGITETTVHVTYKEIKKEEIEIGVSNIGVPIPTLSCYILDKNKQLVPFGVAGELYVGGKGVGKGYLNKEELTTQKFILLPSITPEKLYRSGDLAKFLPTGEMIYLGRIDHQVKIRGFRIELGEIENTLLKHPEINEVTVIDKLDSDNEKYLCAYLVCNNSQPNIATIRTFLLASLPDYMVPTKYVFISIIPLTGNGKVNRKQLPEPEEKIKLSSEYQAPSTETEKQLIGIWEQVLKTKQIGINDNFFELGGHSLKAAQLLSYIQKHFLIEIPFAFIFSSPTPSAMAYYIDTTEKTIYSSIKKADKRAFYPLSTSQKRLFILSQFKGVGTVYNMPGAIEIKGNLDFEKVENAFKKLINYQEAFRTTFHFENDDIIQKIHDDTDFKVGRENCKLNEIDSKIENFIQPFNLENAPLLRVKILEIEADKNILLFDMHHIISDGVSMSILIKEFLDFYHNKELQPLDINYTDYAIWQNEPEYLAKIKNIENYWINKFEGGLPVLNLPTDFPRPLIQKFEGSQLSFEIDTPKTIAIKNYTQTNGTTLYMFFLSVYNILLSRITGQEDIIIGTPIAGRNTTQLENIIGVFINTLALRNSPKWDLSFNQFLQELKINVLTDFSNQELPFEQLIEKLNIVRDTSRNPLFDTIFTFGNADEKQLKIEGLQIDAFPFKNNISKFDITLGGSELENKIYFTLEYSTELFKESTINRLKDTFIMLIDSIIANPNSNIAVLPILLESDKNKLLNEFNNTQSDFKTATPIHQQIDSIAIANPNQIALVFENEKANYNQLKNASDSVATVLREKGIKRGDIVGVLLSPSIEMLYCIIGILKSGATYLPIDTNYPKDRIKHILDDSQAKILISEPEIEIDETYKGVVINFKNHEIYSLNSAPENINSATDTAYIIYTSGTTGNPKGVEISHKSLHNLVHWHIQNYQVTSADIATKYAGVGFDASVWEIFPYLVSGATIHIIADEIRIDIEKLNKYYLNNAISISFLPTQIAEQFITFENNILKKLLIGGDKLNHFMEKNYEIYNNYGPSEYTVVATSYKVEKQAPNIPIGKPIANTKIYIVDKNNNLMPIGMFGELCISGEGIAKGYLNQPELSSTKFVKNPFEANNTMYKTGDWARWLEDGNIEFVGRIDTQVKIRGYRIELGEIQSILNTFPAIKNSIVIDRKDADGNKFLCAYLVVKENISPADIRQYLAKNLPDYMIPAYFIVIDNIPLTANGKADLNALKQINLDGNILTTAEYVAPTTDTEMALVAIWKQVLGMEKIGINDNFFELGGNSLKIIKTLKLIQDKFPEMVEIGDLFDKATIELLAKYIDSKLETKTGETENEIRVIDF